MAGSLTPHPLDRLRRRLGRGWPRRFAVRRLLAALLVLAAAVLAVAPARSPDEPTVPMLVAARALAPGTTLRAADVRVVAAPEPLRPAAALHDVADVRGRVLAGAATEGEPITTARLVGAENSRLSTGAPDAVAVPVRLTDPAVAALLSPGTRVDVVTSAADGEPSVLATAARVITVRADEPGRGAGQDRLVVIALPSKEARKVASAALGQPVAVTLS
jgi:pilus assembly protein CpaB